MNEKDKNINFDKMKECLCKLNVAKISNMSFLKENESIDAVALLHLIAVSFIWGYKALPNWINIKNQKFFFNTKSFNSFNGDNGIYFKNNKECTLNYCKILIQIKNQIINYFDLMNEEDLNINYDNFFQDKSAFHIKYYYFFIFNKELSNEIEGVSEIISSMDNIDTYRKLLFKIIVYSNLNIDIDTKRPTKRT